jgi:hypothetical protein
MRAALTLIAESLAFVAGLLGLFALVLTAGALFNVL